MGQIVKRRKKARQSDDFDLHVKSKSRGVESGYRRSLRRRNARPIIDYDDYLDEYEEEMMLVDDEESEEDEEDDEEEEGERRRRKKKKLQSVVKLAEYESDSMPSRRGGRGTRGAVEEDDDDDYEAEAHDLDMENDDDNMERGPKGESREEESDPGTPIQTQIVVPLPDKKLLELILDKLQKKDIYGVYAEPVDPEELPDYFDIITHPMDFATVRKKLANGKYSTLDQIETFRLDMECWYAESKESHKLGGI